MSPSEGTGRPRDLPCPHTHTVQKSLFFLASLLLNISVKKINYKPKKKHFKWGLTVARAAPVPTRRQGASERPRHSSRRGAESLLRSEAAPQPRGSVVVVHAQEGAGARARTGTQPHHIHTFVHHREERTSRTRTRGEHGESPTILPRPPSL